MQTFEDLFCLLSPLSACRLRSAALAELSRIGSELEHDISRLQQQLNADIVAGRWEHDQDATLIRLRAAWLNNEMMRYYWSGLERVDIANWQTMPAAITENATRLASSMCRHELDAFCNQVIGQWAEPQKPGPGQGAEPT